MVPSNNGMCASTRVRIHLRTLVTPMIYQRDLTVNVMTYLLDDQLLRIDNHVTMPPQRRRICIQTQLIIILSSLLSFACYQIYIINLIDGISNYQIKIPRTPFSNSMGNQRTNPNAIQIISKSKRVTNEGKR